MSPAISTTSLPTAAEIERRFREQIKMGSVQPEQIAFVGPEDAYEAEILQEPKRDDPPTLLETALHGPAEEAVRSLAPASTFRSLQCSCTLKVPAVEALEMWYPGGISKECEKVGKPVSWFSKLSILCHLHGLLWKRVSPSHNHRKGPFCEQQPLVRDADYSAKCRTKLVIP